MSVLPYPPKGAASGGSRGFVLLLLAACNHAPLPAGGTDLSPAQDLSQTQDLSLVDLAVGCTASPLNFTIQIPHGAILGNFGWAWYDAGDCTETPSMLIRSDDNPSRDPVQVSVRFQPHSMPGTQMVMVTVWTDPMAQPIEATGTATLTSAEALSSTSLPTLAGTIDVNDNGIVFSGSFSVRHCPMLDLYCV